MKSAHWLLVVSSTPLGWLVAFGVATATRGVLHRLCPPDLFISGLCIAPWYPAAEIATLAIAAAIGAACAIAMPACLAPAHRRQLTLLAFLVGAISAASLLFSVGARFLIPVAAALTAAALTGLWLNRSGIR